MAWILQNLWWIPAAPLLAAAVLSIMPRGTRQLAASLSLIAMVFSFLLSLCAFALTLKETGYREQVNFDWLSMGDGTLQLGWVLDPLTACMLVMVTFVGSLIFMFSVGYMIHDERFKQFFCFLSLFAAAMLGLVISNSLLMLFMCWEVVGLASYLLIGFWFHKPSAAAAAKKAFITTRIGDVFFFLGILWLYKETGTLLFYDNGNGCLEQDALTKLASQSLLTGMGVSTAISLLLFCGAMGKSGQLPLHVWLPDAMEGPTPVSALIHAATMVAAGVFLVARVFPLMATGPGGLSQSSPALQVVTWVGAITAVFAACVAVAQNDIKRILAYSTVSQLGYMFMGIGVGGVAVGMFHLITHAFFKALLFLGSGSVIHGCHEEQDIRRMGGLKRYMPVTFVTYAVGMLALAGVVPLAGFWSKDEILHAAHGWGPSHWPFVLGLVGAGLTAFYMTRQMLYVFFGRYRGGDEEHAHVPHESPWIMTVPLVVLAVSAVVLGFVGTPALPWFQSYLDGKEAHVDFHHLMEADVLLTMLASTVIALGGIWLGWKTYANAGQQAEEKDAVEVWQPGLFELLQRKFYFDELYEVSVIAFNAWWARVCHWMDDVLWSGLVKLVLLAIVALAWVNRLFEEFVINLGFDKACNRVRGGGRNVSRWQDGNVQGYLRIIGIALVLFVLALTWGCDAS